MELSAVNEPFNEVNACNSVTNGNVYEIPRNSYEINMLTNQKCDAMYHSSKFTITEIEVWGVNFNE